MTALIKDDCGNLSSFRVGFLFFLLVFFGNWTYANIAFGQFHPLNFGDMATLASAFLAKAWSKKEEAKTCAVGA